MDCPVANAYSPEIARIVKEFGPRGVASFAVYSDASVKPDAARRHLREYSLPCPGLMDGDHRLALKFGCTKTPECALLSPEGRVLYRGRVDDTYADYGKRRPNPTRRDLRTALAEALAGRRVSVPVTPVVGCYIPDIPAK